MSKIQEFAGVIRSLFVGETDSETEKIARALVYSFVDYTLFSTIQSLLHRKVASPFANSGSFEVRLPSSSTDLMILFGLSVFVGLVVAYYKNHDGHRILRFFGFTQRTTRVNVWNDVFSGEPQCYINVILCDGRRLFGWPLFYSDSPPELWLFLSEAEWLTEDEDGNSVREPTGGSGILITPEMKIAAIDFLRSAEDSTGEEPGKS